MTTSVEGASLKTWTNDSALGTGDPRESVKEKGERLMKCVICKQGETQPGMVTVTLERGTTTLVFKGVPAQVCANCGEAYVDATVTGQLLDVAETALRAGVQVEVRSFVAA